MSTDDNYTADEYQAEVRKLRAELMALRTETANRKPKRLSLSEVLEAHLERMVKASSGAPSSVTLKNNAKGDTQREVVVRVGDSPDVTTVEEASAKCVEIYNALGILFPLGGVLRASDGHGED